MAYVIEEIRVMVLKGQVVIGGVTCDLEGVKEDYETLAFRGFGKHLMEWSLLHSDPTSDLTESKAFLDEREQTGFNNFVGLPNIYKTLGFPQDTKRSWDSVKTKDYIEAFNERGDESHKLNEFIKEGWLYCVNTNSYHNPDMEDKLIKTAI